MGKRGEFDSWLVLLAQSGSRDALNELFEGIQEPLFRYINSLIKEPQLAEDVLQEVFVRIYKKLRWLREPQAFRSWSYQIASREAFRMLRRERRWVDQIRDEEVLLSLPADAQLAEFDAELVSELPQLINELSPASRAVIVLFYQHELTLSETAAALEIPIGTVKSRLAYGLERLRRRLVPGEGPEEKNDVTR
jgi:RNA polymerase sigma-70 factor, ECF subfamily